MFEGFKCVRYASVGTVSDCSCRQPVRIRQVRNERPLAKYKEFELNKGDGQYCRTAIRQVWSRHAFHRYSDKATQRDGGRRKYHVKSRLKLHDRARPSCFQVPPILAQVKAQVDLLVDTKNNKNGKGPRLRTAQKEDHKN